jgi:hypothetical protein
MDRHRPETVEAENQSSSAPIIESVHSLTPWTG